MTPEYGLRFYVGPNHQRVMFWLQMHGFKTMEYKNGVFFEAEYAKHLPVGAKEIISAGTIETLSYYYDSFEEAVSKFLFEIEHRVMTREYFESILEKYRD